MNIKFLKKDFSDYIHRAEKNYKQKVQKSKPNYIN